MKERKRVWNIDCFYNCCWFVIYLSRSLFLYSFSCNLFFSTPSHFFSTSSLFLSLLNLFSFFSLLFSTFQRLSLSLFFSSSLFSPPSGPPQCASLSPPPTRPPSLSTRNSAWKSSTRSPTTTPRGCTPTLCNSL